MAAYSTNKWWFILIVACLLNVIEPISSNTPKPKRRYKLNPFYEGEVKIRDAEKSALIEDILLLGHVLNNTADTVFGSKDMVRDLLTFFTDLEQIIGQWLFLFLICSSCFHMIACACVGCCACYVFKSEIRSTLKFAKQQANPPNEPSKDVPEPNNSSTDKGPTKSNTGSTRKSKNNSSAVKLNTP